MRRLLFFATLLTACSRPARDEKLEEEIRAREAYAKRLVEEADAGRMTKVMSRSDVIFEEGFSKVLYDPDEDFRAHAFRWMGKQGHVRLRNTKNRPMRLYVEGWVNKKVIQAHPVITAYVDGQYLETTNEIWFEHWKLDVVVPPEMMRGREWLDLTLACNAVGFHWSDPPELRVIVVYDFKWEEP